MGTCCTSTIQATTRVVSLALLHVDQNITTTFGSIDNTSFNDGQKQNNECLGVEGKDTFQDMLEVKKCSVLSPLHLNMGIKNQNSPVFSPIIHPSPLHPNIILQDLHILRNIKGARNHYQKLVEVEIHQHVMVPWEPFVPLPFKPQLGLFHLLHYTLKKFNRENFPWMISKPNLQVIGLIRMMG
jgi:hypothetical protein